MVDGPQEDPRLCEPLRLSAWETHMDSSRVVLIDPETHPGGQLMSRKLKAFRTFVFLIHLDRANQPANILLCREHLLF